MIGGELPETAPPVPPPLIPRNINNRAGATGSGAGGFCGQHARIDLVSGRSATGKREMQESLTVFEELYRTDPKDPTSMGELAYSDFDLFAEELSLDPAGAAASLPSCKSSDGCPI